MAEAGIAAGAEAGGVGVIAGLFADLGSKVSMVQKAVEDTVTTKPVHRPFIVSIVTVGTGVQALIIPSVPQRGRMWFVSRVGIFGSDGHTTVANALADVYMGPSEGNPDFSGQVYSALPIPTIIEEGRFHNPVKELDNVYALVYGAAAGINLTFAILVAEYTVESMEAQAI